MGGFQNFSDPGDGGRGKMSPKLGDKLKSALSDALEPDQKPEDNTLQGFKKGGMVKKTGAIKAHKGERVLTKAQAKKYNKKKGR